MSNELIQEAVHRIHYKPVIDSKVVVAIAGNGVGGVADLMGYGGGSRTLLRQHLLYDFEAFNRYIGGKPDKYVSNEAARQLAMAAYQEALDMMAGTDRENYSVAGIGCTASLVKPTVILDGEVVEKPERDGRRHEIHMAVQTRANTYSYALKLNGGDRVEQETIAERVVLAAVAKARGLEIPKCLDPQVGMMDFDIGGMPIESSREAPREWVEVVHGRSHHFISKPPGHEGRLAVFPGSFNPLHEGHLRMREAAQEILGRPVYFELGVQNVDKPPLDYEKMGVLVSQFKNRDLPLILSSRAKFIDKAAGYGNGVTFVVGFDTYQRIGDPAYYAGGHDDLGEAVDVMEEWGVEFLVFARGDASKTVRNHPNPLQRLCQQVPPEKFLMPVSSTEIRKAK